MFRYIYCVLALFLLANVGCGGSGLIIRKEDPAVPQSSLALGVKKKNVKTMAIFPFARTDDELEPDYARLRRNAEKKMTTLAEKAAIKHLPFKVVSRTEVDKILAEQSFQQSDLVDGSKRKELGKLLSADAILLGKVNSYAIKAQRLGKYETLVKIGEVNFSIKLVDVESGQILWSGSHQGSTKRLLSDEEVEFEIDKIKDRVKENDAGDRKKLKNLELLAQQLLKELFMRLKKSLKEKSS